MARILRTDGTNYPIEDWSPKSVKEIVGKHAREIPLSNGNILIINDPPFNEQASRLYDDPIDIIYGDAILIKADEKIIRPS